MCAPMLKVALAPGASAPNVHVTTFGAVWLQPDDAPANVVAASEEHTSVLQLRYHRLCRVTLAVKVMSVPAVAVAGPVLLIDRSARRLTVVVAVAVLLSGLSSSGCAAVSTAVFVNAHLLAFPTRRSSDLVALAPGASAATVHVTTFGAV